MKNRTIKEILGLNHPIHTTYWQSGENESSKIVCVFPGFSYPSEAPITFYQKLFFLDLGFDWISFDYRLNENEEFMSLPDKEQKEYFIKIQKNIGEYIIKNFKGKEIIFLGKSVGTTAITELFSELNFLKLFDDIKIILLTPTDSSFKLNKDIVRYKLKTLIVIGDNDPFYNDFIKSELYTCSFVESKIIKDAGHAFEDKNKNIKKSIDNLYIQLEFVEKFLETT